MFLLCGRVLLQLYNCEESVKQVKSCYRGWQFVCTYAFLLLLSPWLVSMGGHTDQEIHPVLLAGWNAILNLPGNWHGRLDPVHRSPSFSKFLSSVKASKNVSFFLFFPCDFRVSVCEVNGFVPTAYCENTAEEENMLRDLIAQRWRPRAPEQKTKLLYFSYFSH